MKVLLDEDLDHRLRKSIEAHEVFTVSAAINRATPGSFQEVECGRFTRKRQQQIQVEPELELENEQEQDRSR